MISGSFTDADPWFLLFGAGPVLLVGAGWLFMAATLVFRGNDVDKPNRMAQFYGYSVCLLAIIFALFSTTSIIDTAFERANPLQSEERFGFGASLISFESYRATYRREQAMFDRTGTARPDTASEVTLRRQYEGLVTDRVGTVRYRTTKSFVMGVFCLVISALLFFLHWRWVRRLNEKAAA